MSNAMGIPQLTRIERKLDAILKSQKHMYWIGGYAYGRTKGKRDPFILLYAASERLDNKICRVYVEEFKRLPQFISRDIPSNAQEESIDRSVAIRMGIYTPCQMFQIVTHDGDDSNLGPERRFSNVTKISSIQPAATPPPAASDNQPVPGVRADAYRKHTPQPPAEPLRSGKRPAYTRQPMNGRQDTPAATSDDLRAAVMETFIEEHFNTAVVAWLDYFTDAATVAVARGHMWGEFDPAHVSGYAAGLRSYAGSVTTRIATGQGLDLEFKQTAVKKAKLAFDKAINK